MPAHDDRYCFFVAVDAVVFTVIRGSLHVLLIQNKYPPYEHAFALPGGRVRNDEAPEAAVVRELAEETGVREVFLKKFNAYGAVERDPRNRVVSISYLALIDHTSFALRADSDAMTARWTEVEGLSGLAYDHDRILADALAELRMEIQTTNIAYQLLPERFTLSELQALYESVLGRRLDKRNFRKRLRNLDVVEETGEFFRDGAHRPAQLYRFKSQEYESLAERVSVFM